MLHYIFYYAQTFDTLLYRFDVVSGLERVSRLTRSYTRNTELWSLA